jgi:hypothetical protein
MAWPTKKVAQAFRFDLKCLSTVRKALHTTYKPLQYYEAVWHKESHVAPILSSSGPMYQEINQMIDFPLSIVSAHQVVYFKSYISYLGEFQRTMMSAEKDLFKLRLRRSTSSAHQGIFNAVHHQFKSFNESAKRFSSHTVEWVEVSLRKPITAFKRRKLTMLRDSLFESKNVHDGIMALYYDQVIAIFTRHLELMSASDIERRSELVQRYWLTHWQTQRKHDRRLAKFEDYRKRIREARLAYRRAVGQEKAKERRALKAKRQKEWSGREKSGPSVGVKDQHKSGYKQHKNSTSSAGKQMKNSKRSQPDGYPPRTAHTAGRHALYAHEFTQDTRTSY